MSRVLKEKVRQRLLSEYNLLFSKGDINDKELRTSIREILENLIVSEGLHLTDAEKAKIIEEMIVEYVGFGPIDNLIKDAEVTEIMVNGPKKIYVEKRGKKELTSLTFENEKQLLNLIEKLLTPTRRHVDESFPYTEIALKDGARVNIVIPPVALDGPTLTIRKLSREIKTADDLINFGTFDKRMSDFLIASIRAKMNIIFSGATGAGKTTTLNALSYYIMDDERIVTIEDTAELSLRQEHVVRLETRQPNIEGKGEISIRELFKNSLRMRPSRIILGEIRGSEALDMIQAICSGHGGALSVVHATTPQDVIYRLEAMFLISGLPITLEMVHRQIAAAINLIVQQDQLADGSRRITHITQINGIKDGRVVLEDIFVYDIEGVSADGKVQGSWKTTGIIPVFYPVFQKMGITLPKEIFNKD